MHAREVPLDFHLSACEMVTNWCCWKWKLGAFRNRSQDEVDKNCDSDLSTYEKGIVNQGSEGIPDITTDEVELALRKTKDNKSPGEDNLVSDAIKIEVDDAVIDVQGDRVFRKDRQDSGGVTKDRALFDRGHKVLRKLRGNALSRFEVNKLPQDCNRYKERRNFTLSELSNCNFSGGRFTEARSKIAAERSNDAAELEFHFAVDRKRTIFGGRHQKFDSAILFTLNKVVTDGFSWKLLSERTYFVFSDVLQCSSSPVNLCIF
ncbi:hypothetical protein Trydic_g3829 [Trypoxylus dichotomus]